MVKKKKVVKVKKKVNKPVRGSALKVRKIVGGRSPSKKKSKAAKVKKFLKFLKTGKIKKKKYYYSKKAKRA